MAVKFSLFSLPDFYLHCPSFPKDIIYLKLLSQHRIPPEETLNSAMEQKMNEVWKWGVICKTFAFSHSNPVYYDLSVSSAPPPPLLRSTWRTGPNPQRRFNRQRRWAAAAGLSFSRGVSYLTCRPSFLPSVTHHMSRLICLSSLFSLKAFSSQKSLPGRPELDRVKVCVLVFLYLAGPKIVPSLEKKSSSKGTFYFCMQQF